MAQKLVVHQVLVNSHIEKEKYVKKYSFKTSPRAKCRATTPSTIRNHLSVV